MSITISAQNVTRTFGGLTALSDISFETRPNEVFGIIGPNGAGKSTLFNVIAGVYPPVAGQVKLGSEIISGQSVSRIARKGLARTFQSPALLKNETVQENLIRAALLPHFHGPLAYFKSLFRGIDVDEKQLDAALDMVSLGAERDRVAGTLAYGQQKILGLAMALMQKPKVILMDEPAAGLNSTEKQEMSRLIRRLRDDFGVSVLVVEHDMKLIMGVCDRILTIAYGTFVALGSPEEIRSNPRVIDAYLGQDYEFA